MEAKKEVRRVQKSGKFKDSEQTEKLNTCSCPISDRKRIGLGNNMYYCKKHDTILNTEKK